MTRAYLTLSQGTTQLGTLNLIISETTVPRTAENFLTLLQRPTGAYRNSTLHRIIPKFMAQGGDFTNGDGTGGNSIYGPNFADENFVLSHDSRGTLSMANSGPDTNGSQFFLTFRPTPHLDEKHVVFGRVDLNDDESSSVLDMLERVQTGHEDRPRVAVTISDCGLLGQDGRKVVPAAVAVAGGGGTALGMGKSSAAADEDEIDLDDDYDDDDADEGDAPTKPQHNPPAAAAAADAAAAEKPASDKIGAPEEEEDADPAEEQEEEDDGLPPPKNAKEALQQRLRKLKLKMNQSRRLNRREVQSEGERLGTDEGAAKARRRQAKEDRDRRSKEWEEMNGRAVATAAAALGGAGGGVDGAEARKLTEQAADTLRKAQRKSERAAVNRYGVDDHYNPEGQHRNYERSLRTVPRGLAEASAASASSAAGVGGAVDDVYDPTNTSLATFGASASAAASSERAGAGRLSSELKRRAAKTDARRKRKNVEFEASDVSHINQRNKRFNEKIGRAFDSHTAEIRQNLERGTAL